MSKISIIFLISLISFSAFSLEIDEKLTLRVLKLSDSKKTMLINRGVEDGLAEGDHAKFFISTGVVARGVLVKLSPTRSVWSMYRLVNPELINTDAVMNLKIASPVKVSEDESRMIVKDPDVVKVSKGDPDKVDIPLAEGADDLEKGMTEGLSKNEKEEIATIMGNDDESRKSILHKNAEVFGLLNLNYLGGSTKPDNGTPSGSADYKILQVLLGLEHYFRSEEDWYSTLSFFPYINYDSKTITAGNGLLTNITAFEYGLGVNWHPITKPSQPLTLIPFATMAIGRGSFLSKSENTFPSAVSSTVEQDGSLSTFYIGAGLKYYWSNGFGLRTTLDYYIRSTSLPGVPENGNVAFDVSQSGLRTFAGFSYRW